MSQTMQQNQGVTIPQQSIQQIISLLQGALQGGGNGQFQQGQGQGAGGINQQALFGELSNCLSYTPAAMASNSQLQHVASSFIRNLLDALSNDQASAQQVQQILRQSGGGQNIQQIANQAAQAVVQALPGLLAQIGQRQGGGIQYQGGNYSAIGQPQQPWNN